MRLGVRGIVLGAILIAPVCAFAEQASPPKEEGESLELRHKGPPIVAPTPQSPEAIREAEESVEELDRTRRQEQRLRETRPSPPRRPDLDYDVKSGIQQKAIERALPPK